MAKLTENERLANRIGALALRGGYLMPKKMVAAIVRKLDAADRRRAKGAAKDIPAREKCPLCGSDDIARDDENETLECRGCGATRSACVADAETGDGEVADRIAELERENAELRAIKADLEKSLADELQGL